MVTAERLGDMRDARPNRRTRHVYCPAGHVCGSIDSTKPVRLHGIYCRVCREAFNWPVDERCNRGTMSVTQ